MAGYDARIRVMLQATEALNGLNKIEDKIRRITEATQNQALKVNLPRQYKELVKSTEKSLNNQLRLNAATSLYERRLVQINRAGGLRTDSQKKELNLLQQIASKHGNNLRLMESIASVAGKLLETVRETNREDKKQNQLRRELYTYEQQIQALAEQGLKQSEINALLKTRDVLSKQISKKQLDLAGITNDRLKQQIKLKNKKFEELEITKRISAEEQKALQTAGLRLRSLAKSIDSIINKANRIPGAGPGGQLALPPAKPGSPAMSGGARRRVSGNTEILGGGRSVQEAAQALFMAERFPGASPVISPIGTPPDRITEPRRSIFRQAELEEAASIARSARIARERNAQIMGGPAPYGFIGPAQRPADFPVATSTGRIREELNLRQKINLAIDAQLQKEQQRLKFLQGATQYSSPAGPSDLKRRQFQESVAGLKRIRGQGGRGLPPEPKGAGARKFFTQFADFGLGAGFPLLFGGGAGQVAGGGIGTALGKSLGLASQAVFGLQIAFSAIGDQIEQAVRRVKEMQDALEALDMDRLAATAVNVTAELRSQVRELLRAGEFQKAYEVAARETALQTGLLFNQQENLVGQVNYLSNAWNRLVASASGLLSIIGAPIATALGVIVDSVALIFKGWNMILTVVGEFISRLPGVAPLLEFIRKQTEQTSEEYEKQIDLIDMQLNQKFKELRDGKESLDLEKSRTLALDQAGKIKNIEVDVDKQLNALEKERVSTANSLREQYGQLINQRGADEKGLELRLNLELQNLDVVKEHAEQEIRLNAERSKAKAILEGNKKELTEINSRMQKQFDLQKAATDLAKAQATLDIQRSNRVIETTKSTAVARREYNNIYKATVALANADYEIGVANLRLEESKIEALIAQSKIQESLLRAKIKENELNASVAAIYQEALQFQQDATGEAYKQLDSVRAANDIRQRALEVQRQTTIEAAEYTRQTNIASLSTKKTAVTMGGVATATGQAAQQSATFASNLERSANAANNIVSALSRKTGGLGQTSKTYTVSGAINIPGASKEAVAQAGGFEQFNDFMMRNKGYLSYLREWNRFANKVIAADQQLSASGATRPPAYASGGYVSSPTNAMIGEGGSEYVIPASKMSAAMERYAAGKRGDAVVPNGNDTQVNVSTGPVMQMNGQNYVTQSDFEKGLRSTVNQVMTTLRRSPNTRAAVGI